MTLQLINQYSIAGAMVPPSYNNQQDYLNRVNLLVNDAQTIIATTVKKLFAQFKITQNPIKNELGNTLAYDVIQHLNYDIAYKADSAKAYYFEVDDVATIDVVVGGVVVETISNDVSGEGFKSFKGLITDIGEVQLVFKGDYSYNIRNVALYDVSFPSADKIPAFVPYREYKMPDDFFQLVGRGIPYINGDRVGHSKEYSWRGKDILLLDSNLKGEWTVDYYRYPTPIATDSAPTTELDNTIDAQLAIPYYVAAHLIMEDDSNRSYIFMNEWELKLSRLGDAPQTLVNRVEDVYFSSGYGI